MKKIDLSGSWFFCMDRDGTGESKGYQTVMPKEDTILLPSTVSESKKGIPSKEAPVDHLTDPYLFEGSTWYSRQIELTEYAEQECFLVLEKTRVSKVWINGTYLGRQDSLCTSHRYALTGAIRKGSNQITICVDNVSCPVKGGHMTSPDTQTNWNGILGEIAIEVHPVTWLSDVKIMTESGSRKMQICFQLHGRKETKLTAWISHGGEWLSSTDYIVNPGVNSLELTWQEHLTEWSEYQPCLHKLHLEPEQGEEWKGEFGIRTFAASGHYFTINGMRTFLRGKHDGMVFPLTGYAPMDVSSWEQVFQTARAYGINHYRFHTCCPPEAAFRAADHVGMYLSPELPFWGDIAEPGTENYDGISEQYLIEEGYRILDTFGNHPSFVMMSMGNELWGSPKRVNEIVGLYRSYDSRRLYTQGSNNFQFTPCIAENEDYFCGVRFSKERLFRGSYAMCDAPQGHIQTCAPDTTYNYDNMIRPIKSQSDSDQSTEDTAGTTEQEITIQFGTGTKKVKGSQTHEIMPKLPVVSHEIGQYTFYPDFGEIKKYTGVLKAHNLESMRERVRKRGLLFMADAFFRSAGKFAAACYKAELETALRSRELAGFQLLDLQDFPGQGTALVGILNAFMENKGLISDTQWREFCSENVLLGELPSFVYQSGEQVELGIKLAAFSEQPVTDRLLCMTGQICQGEEQNTQESAISCTTQRITQQIEGPEPAHDVVSLGSVTVTLPEVTMPVKYQIELSLGALHNAYRIWIYPQLTGWQQKRLATDLLLITDNEQEMRQGLQEGRHVLYYPQNLDESNSIEGTYCTDFWCYPMFRSISESVGRKVPVGTLGLCIDEKHPIFTYFPTEHYSTPQWYEIVSQGRAVILDEYDICPIVWTIDNFERNHRLGNLFEVTVEKGRLVVCTTDLRRLSNYLPAQWLQYGILSWLMRESGVKMPGVD